jgi:hypothetical protein
MNRRTSLYLLGAVAALGLTSCQSWGPTWSEVSGARYNLTVMNRYPTGINAIDSQNPGPVISGGYYRYYKLTPGDHAVEIQALNPTPGWVQGINLQSPTINFEPCKRYYVNAQFENQLQTDWKPVIDYVEPIAGCTVVTASAK